MQPSSKMLSAAAAALLATLPLAGANVSPSVARCVRSTSRAAASEAGCGGGDAGAAALARCLGLLPDDYFVQADVERCYLEAGCGADESAVLAIEVLARCSNMEDPVAAAAAGGGGDLRKRQRVTPPSNTDEADATDVVDTAADETDTADNADPTDSTDEVQTTDEPTAPTTIETPATDVTDATTATQTDASNTPVTAPAATTTDTDICTTPATSTVQTCTTTTSAGKADIDCFPTPIVKMKCRDGYLCTASSAGKITCMKKRDELTTGGIIVAIAFSAAVAISIALMTFFCCREKSQQKKLKARMEAAAIAKASGAGKKRDANAARQPLMPGGAQDGTGYGGGQPPQQFSDGVPAQSNPFQDPPRF